MIPYRGTATKREFDIEIAFATDGLKTTASFRIRDEQNIGRASVPRSWIVIAGYPVDGEMYRRSPAIKDNIHTLVSDNAVIFVAYGGS